jgi:vacuolar iron transporter family protein
MRLPNRIQALRAKRRFTSFLPHLHFDNHFTGSETLRDVVMGMADGLTVPFVLASGVSGAVASTHIVLTAGLAEVFAGAIAMGLAGFIAAKDAARHYERVLHREEGSAKDVLGQEVREISELFEAYGVTPSEAAAVVAALHRKPMAWRSFMMRFDLGLEAPDPKRPVRSALTIACSYIVCGMIPLVPYMIHEDLHDALLVSTIVTLLALAAFGAVKGHYMGVSMLACAWQTALVGSLAAGIAFGIAKVIA